jgi:hypothetical protein
MGFILIRYTYDWFGHRATDMTSIWHGLIDTLRLLPPMQPYSKVTFDATTDPIRPVPVIQAEQKTLEEALGKLTMLITLRRNEEAGLSNAQHLSHAIPSVQVSTPSSTNPGVGSGGSGVKRKRRTSLSYSASPAPMGMPNTADSALTNISSPLPRGGTPGGRDLPLKRKDVNGDHSILAPQTKVALKMTNTVDETWIAAVIDRCVNVEKQVYDITDNDSGEK